MKRLNWLKLLPFLFFFCLAAGWDAHADDSTAADQTPPIRQTRQAVKKDVQTTGSEVKETARDVKEAAPETSPSFKKAYGESRDAVKDAVHKP